MPWSARRPCRTVGCGHLQPCPVHRERAWVRPSRAAAVRTRGATWQRLVAEVIADEPVCYLCGARASETADHVVPLAEGGTNDRSNLRGACRRCNRSKAARESAIARRRATAARREVDGGY